jgi:hypothetical protein
LDGGVIELQKIVILAEGTIATSFLGRIASENLGNLQYDIVVRESLDIHSELYNVAKIHHFDPTNEFKLRHLITKDVSQVIVLLEDPDDTAMALGIVREKNDTVPIVTLTNHKIASICEELKVKTLDVNQTISSMLVNFLPTVPLIASNIGQGIGEIMEVLVPYGSKYVFRHLSNIEQKNWRIVAIYRENKLILPKQSTMIIPNDELLLVGKPEILKDIYKSIKSELGQFPQPFGSNIFFMVDVQKISLANLQENIEELQYLSTKLNNKKLIIKAKNMTNTEQGDYLRSLISEDVIVDMDFFGGDLKETLSNDIKKYNVGLISMTTKEFMRNGMRRILFDTKKPILKLSSKSIKNAKESIIMLNDDKYIEQISNVFFDVSIQLNSQTVLADFDPDEKNKSELYEHFTNLANIYTKKLQIEKGHKNPIRELKKRENFIQFLPFEESMVKGSLLDFFKPRSNTLFRLLDEHTQIFIPTME